MNYDLMVDPLYGKDVLAEKQKELVDKLQKRNPNLKKNTIGKIVRAYLEGSLIDRSGAIWIEKGYLHTVLRTDIVSAKLHAICAKRSEIVNFDNKIYLSGSLVASKLHSRYVRSSGITKLYVELSEEIFQSVTKSDKAVLRQLEFIDRMAATKKSLKKKRKTRLSIETDELTGEPLEKGSEFSHILYAGYYFKYSDKDWNGLVVNKGTHDLITSKSIVDDSQLIKLCRSQNWSTDWIADFQKGKELCDTSEVQVALQ